VRASAFCTSLFWLGDVRAVTPDRGDALAQVGKTWQPEARCLGK